MVKAQLEIIFVTNFYDIPLAGLCWYDGKVERFESDYDTQKTTIIFLTRYERFKALLGKKLFEICVGTHHTYKNNRKASYFYWRKPVILHKILYKLYYAIKR